VKAALLAVVGAGKPLTQRDGPRTHEADTPPLSVTGRLRASGGGVAEREQDGGMKHERKGAAMTTATTRKPRELASRESNGLAVVLLWHPRENAVTVSVTDSRTGDRFQLAVHRKRALEAFYHPFAYAA